MASIAGIGGARTVAPTPTPGQITVALDALEHDAVRWSRAADELRAAAEAVRGQAVDPSAFSFTGGAAAAAYTSLQTKILRLLGQGADNCAAIAAALRASAATYAAEEAKGVHRFRHVY